MGSSVWIRILIFSPIPLYIYLCYQIHFLFEFPKRKYFFQYREKYYYRSYLMNIILSFHFDGKDVFSLTTTTTTNLVLLELKLKDAECSFRKRREWYRHKKYPDDANSISICALWSIVLRLSDKFDMLLYVSPAPFLRSLYVWSQWWHCRQRKVSFFQPSTWS